MLGLTASLLAGRVINSRAPGQTAENRDLTALFVFCVTSRRIDSSDQHTSRPPGGVLAAVSMLVPTDTNCRHKAISIANNVRVLGNYKVVLDARVELNHIFIIYILYFYICRV